MNRNGAIDFLKFIFIFMVAIFHGKNFAGDTEHIFQLGAIGVEFFFIVSGYLMAVSATKRMQNPIPSIGPDTASFLWHKIKGLIPDVYVAWVIGFIVECAYRGIPLGEWVRNFCYSAFDWLFLTQTGLMGFRANAVSWYLSAMLLAMAILYPIFVRKRELFLSLLAPLIAVLLLGYMYQSWKSGFGGPSSWTGFACKGAMRAVACICLGCVCYRINEKTREIKPTALCRGLLTILEFCAYLFVIVMAYDHRHSKLDFLMVLAYVVGVTISFSQKSFSSQIFRHRVFNWLGIFSFDLFLGHGFWSHAVSSIFPDLTYWQILPRYLAIDFATALVIMYTSKFIKKKWPAVSARLKRALLEEKNG